VRASGGFGSQRYAAKVARPASLSAGLNSLASHKKVQDGLEQPDGSPAHVVTARHGTWQLLSAKTHIIFKKKTTRKKLGTW